MSLKNFFGVKILYMFFVFRENKMKKRYKIVEEYKKKFENFAKLKISKFVAL